MLVYALARRLLGPRAAIPAALVWMTTQFLVEQFRIATADPYLTFFTLLSVWSFLSRRPVLMYAALGLGILAKGPIIFLTALPAIAALRIMLPRVHPIANRYSSKAKERYGL